jgi:hypothetical protein
VAAFHRITNTIIGDRLQCSIQALVVCAVLVAFQLVGGFRVKKATKQ